MSKAAKINKKYADKSANDIFNRAKKEADSLLKNAKTDLGTVNTEVSSNLGKLFEGNNPNFENSLNTIRAANDALEQELTQVTATNQGVLDSDMATRGQRTIPLGMSRSAMAEQQIAGQQGLNALQNMGTLQRNTEATYDPYRSAGTGIYDEWLQNHTNTRNEEVRNHRLTLDQALAQNKIEYDRQSAYDRAQAAARAAAYRRNSGGGTSDAGKVTVPKANSMTIRERHDAQQRGFKGGFWDSSSDWNAPNTKTRWNHTLN